MATVAPRSSIQIRTYRPGDEAEQVAIYNSATRDLPAFKIASVDEVSRRNRAADFDPNSKLYAERDGKVVGYISFSSNGRVSAPWCLDSDHDAAGPLFEALFAAMRLHGHRRAWAAYRADWPGVRHLLEHGGFRQSHEIVNYVASMASLPREPVPSPFAIRPLRRDDVIAAYRLDPAAFGVASADALARAWLDGPYMSADSLFVLQDESGSIGGVGLAILNPNYADVAKIDSAMPCFRLGTTRTESERTKRVNGVFSYVARVGPENGRFALWLLTEACRRMEAARVTQVAAQCPSDRPTESAFYAAYFQRQQAFPVFVRDL